jgi:predicted transposase YdaD
MSTSTPTPPPAHADSAVPENDVTAFTKLLHDPQWTHNPHDLLFKNVYQHPAEIAALYKDLFPPEVTDLIDWEHLKPEPTEFANPSQNERHADLVFSAITPDSPFLPCLLHLEEQTKWETHFPVRLLGYLSALYANFVAAFPANAILPRVLIVVLYNGKTPWKAPTDFEHLLAPAATPRAQEILVPYALRFSFKVIDLPSLAPDRLVGTECGKMILDLMASIRRDDPETFLRRNGELLEKLRTQEKGYQRTFFELAFTYLISTNQKLDRRGAVKLFSELPKATKGSTMTLYQSILLEGRTEGRNEGELFGAIRFAQKHLGLKPMPDTELEGKPLSELETLLAKLDAQVQKRFALISSITL